MTHSSGFCLETLLEAAKFVEEQEQQQLQQQEQQQQIFVVASGIPNPKGICESETGLPLLPSKADTGISGQCLKQGKKILYLYI